MGIQTPFLQALAVATHLWVMLPARVMVAALMAYWLLYGALLTKLLVLAYATFVVWDAETPHKGGRSCDAFRQSWYFKYLAEYFPLDLIQTADLPPDKNYLVVCHPHGVLFLAYTLVFAADVFLLRARKGLRTFVTTLNSNFVLPLAREYLLASGFVSVSEQSLKHLLSEPAGGNLVSLLPGGSAEAGLVQPGKYHILLDKRKGFCRVALQTGASLVPTFAFGEVDCYTVDPATEGSLLARCQQWVRRWTGINPVFFRNPDSSLHFMSMPKRVPITVVMGTPISVEQKLAPSREDIEQLHGQYVASVRSLFEQYKHKYLNNAGSVELLIE